MQGGQPRCRASRTLLGQEAGDSGVGDPILMNGHVILFYECPGASCPLDLTVTHHQRI